MEPDNILFLRWVVNHAYPNLTYLMFLILAVLVQFTFSGNITRKEDLSAWDHIVVYFKTKALVLYVFLVIAFNALVLLVAFYTLGKDDGLTYMGMIYQSIGKKLFTFGSLLSLITVFFIPYFLHVIHRRFVSPKISAWRRKYRISQTGDALSDIRIEADKYQTKNFDNRSYYKDGFVFLGLNEKDEPIYIEDEDFKKKNIQVLGATQTGKGVLQQVIADQAIMKGWGFWFFDQKPDDFIYSVMVESCLHWNRPLPVVLDLTGESVGEYAPFEHGNKRERLGRFNKLFGLVGKGTDGDYYKGINRSIMTFLSDYWDGTLQHLDKLIHKKDDAIPPNKRDWIFENSLNIQTKLDEWKLLPHLFPPKGTGFNVQNELNNASVVYVRGRQDDDLIRDVCTSLLVEWKDCVVKKLHSCHIFVELDEAKFVMSPTVASALATVLSKNANMLLAVQERDDIKNVPDATVDKEALKNQVETNVLITVSYACSFDTAEWMAKNTGTIQKVITKMEQVDTDGFGAESWAGKRNVGSEEEYLIPINSIQSLNRRVGVMISNDRLAQYIFTSFVPVNTFHDLPVREIPEIQELSEQVDDMAPILNDEIISTKTTETETDGFNPDDDPALVEWLNEQFLEDMEVSKEVVSNSDKPNGEQPSPESESDLISSFGKKGN
ncbi:triK protein [Scandinavium goeteborgense]|uniref:TriK protein n=1 Tax=Scandinavium goeteborgense TaxID=1851514 RepID=A0A4R6DU05_SCAGO|nr:triK protein [Scandinavium goeteborgense]TDN48079.1 hypothetical protein EC847_12830 [Scandinavium goeteborgense]